MIRLVALRAQRVGGLRGPHLNRHRSASCFNKGLSSVLLRKNEWVLVEGAWGLLLLCDGMMLTKSNIQRQIGNTSVKCEANSPWKRRYNKAIQIIQSNIHAGKKAAKANVLVASCLNEAQRRTAAKDDDSRSIIQKLVAIPETRIDITAKSVVGCSWNFKIHEGS